MIKTWLIYNAILILALACSIGIKACRGWKEWVVRVLLFAVLTLPAALRYNIGTDYSAYVSIYASSAQLFSRVEIGFAGLNYLLYHAGISVEWMFVIMAVLIYAPIAFGVRKKYIVPTIVFYMLTAYLPSFSMIRQSLVISWIMVALLRYLDDEHIGRLYITIAAAAFVHLSAVIVLPFVLFRRIHISAWWVLILLPVVFVFIKNGLIDRLFDSELFLSSKYGIYASSRFNRQTQIGSGLGIALKVITPLLYIILARHLDRRYDTVLYLSAGFLVAVMLSTQVHIFNRLADLLSLAPVVAFSVMYDKLRKPLWLIVITLLMTVNFQQTIRVNQSSNNFGIGISPYTTIFDK